METRYLTHLLQNGTLQRIVSIITIIGFLTGIATWLMGERTENLKQTILQTITYVSMRPEDISRKTRIPLKKVQSLLNQMIRVGLVERDTLGRYFKSLGVSGDTKSN